MKHSSNPPSKDNNLEVSASRGAILLSEFDRFSGGEILERILQEKNPRKVVEEFPAGDFYWIVKKIGSDDSLPLLELATQDQWQYLLDLEIWDRDEVNPTEALAWLKRLFEADSGRTIHWLFHEGNALLYYVLQKSLEVLVREEDDKEFEIPEGFFTHDGVLYVQARDEESQPFLRQLTGAISAASVPAYQTLLSSLASAIPSETEEGMYRMRNTRLAESGFLPFEEAVAVYSPLSLGQLNREGNPTAIDIKSTDEPAAIVPFLPLHEGGQTGCLREAIARIKDPLVLDRLRLEFAGLANQVAAAEGLSRMQLDGLVAITHKAAGYLNIAMEELTGKDREDAANLLGKNSLEALFRVGFGYVLRLKRVAENWLKIAWFRKAGFQNGVWGDERGGLLSGLLLKKPLLYTGLKDGTLYRDFASAEDLSQASRALMKLVAMDGFVAALTKENPLPAAYSGREDLTCFHFLLTYWTRMRLGIEPGFEAIMPDEARAIFAILRTGETKPPYLMARYREAFLEDMLRFASALPDDLQATLKEELEKIWEDFVEEYKDVPPADTDMKHNPFLIIS